MNSACEEGGGGWADYGYDEEEDDEDDEEEEEEDDEDDDDDDDLASQFTSNEKSSIFGMQGGNACHQVAVALVTEEWSPQASKDYHSAREGGGVVRGVPASHAPRDASTYETIIDTKHAFVSSAMSLSFLLRIPSDAALSFESADGLVAVQWRIKFEFTMRKRSDDTNPKSHQRDPLRKSSVGSGGGSNLGAVKDISSAALLDSALRKGRYAGTLPVTSSYFSTHGRGQDRAPSSTSPSTRLVAPLDDEGCYQVIRWSTPIAVAPPPHAFKGGGHRDDGGAISGTGVGSGAGTAGDCVAGPDRGATAAVLPGDGLFAYFDSAQHHTKAVRVDVPIFTSPSP